MKALIPAHQEFIQRALRIPGLKIVYGTDVSNGRARSQFRGLH